MCHVIINTRVKTLVTDGIQCLNGISGGIYWLYTYLGLVLSVPYVDYM